MKWLKKISPGKLSHEHSNSLAVLCGSMAILIAAAVFVSGGARPFSSIMALVTPGSQTACTIWGSNCTNGLPVIAASPNPTPYGTATTLAWDGQDDNGNWLPNCLMYGGRFGGGTPIPGVGNAPSDVITSPISYYYTCHVTVRGQSIYYTSNTVTVYPAAVLPQALTLNASPNPVDSGTGTTLNWTATGGPGYDACLLGGGQYGSSGTPVNTSGSGSTAALTSDTQYWYECHDSAGWHGPVYQTVTVTAPTLCSDASGGGAYGTYPSCQCNTSSYTYNATLNTTHTILLTSGTSWTVPSDWNSANNTIKVIGAGGGGGTGQSGYEGGGGGAGGVVTINNYSATGVISYSIGSGGGASSSGGATTFGSYAAAGGGGGGIGAPSCTNGQSGGSGGGGGGKVTPGCNGGSGTSGQGYGGAGASPTYGGVAGGGGGAGGGGSSTSGGAGVSINGATYATGGNTSGSGAAISPQPANTGNGGTAGENTGGTGGSGVIIITYVTVSTNICVPPLCSSASGGGATGSPPNCQCNTNGYVYTVGTNSCAAPTVLCSNASGGGATGSPPNCQCNTNGYVYTYATNSCAAAPVLCANASGGGATGSPPNCQCNTNGYVYTYATNSCAAALPSITTFSANPTRVHKNISTPVTFSYTVTNPPATTPSCTISGPSGFTTVNLNQTQVNAGSYQTSVTLSQPSAFTLTCGSVQVSSIVGLIPATQEI